MAIAFRAAATNEGVAGTGDTSATVTVPTGTTTGDIIFGFIYAVDNAAQELPSWPNGWTVLEESGVNNPGSRGAVMSMAWKAWQSGESSYTVTINPETTEGWVSIAVSYSGVDSTPTADSAITLTDSGSLGTALSTPTATSSTSGVWRLCCWSGWRAVGDCTWSSYSPADTERQDKASTSATFRASLAVADSNGSVDASGGTSVSATPSTNIEMRGAGIILVAPGAEVAVTQKVTVIDMQNQAVAQSHLW